MGAEILERANVSTEKILAKLSQDQLTLASPCMSWQLGDVVNHIVGNNFWFEVIAVDGVAPDRPNNAAPDETEATTSSALVRDPRKRRGVRGLRWTRP